MVKLFTGFIIVVLLFCRCNSTVNTYENKLGIKPAVLAQIDTANYTTIQWIDTVKNFGMVKEGDSVFAKFRFKNAGDKALFIIEVRSFCGCTVTNYPEHAILPAREGEVLAIFKTNGHPGFIHKTIIVTTNASNKMQQLLSFKGNVKNSLLPSN